MRGKAVSQPMGFEVFGIHTENFALCTGQHPRDLTSRTVENFRAQQCRGGMAWDWRATVDTSSPLSTQRRRWGRRFFHSKSDIDDLLFKYIH
jgi:leucyl-tRNA synthetase